MVIHHLRCYPGLVDRLEREVIMTSETKQTTVTEGTPECALPPREGTRRTPPYIQTVCTQEQFDLHQQRRKELNETWSQYIIAGLELRLATFSKTGTVAGTEAQAGPKQKG